MPASYSWNLLGPAPFSGSAPDPGPGVPGVPQFQSPKSRQFERGIKFGNVPGGDPKNIVLKGGQVSHVNTVMPVLQMPSDKSNLSGVVLRARGRVPSIVSPVDLRNLDEWGNVVFPWTGGHDD